MPYQIFLDLDPSNNLGAPGLNSSYGVPNWAFLIAIVFLGYVVLRVYLSLKRDGWKKKKT